MIINVAELGRILVTEDPRQLIEVEGVDALPDTEGMVLRCEVVLPAFEKGGKRPCDHPLFQFTGC